MAEEHVKRRLAAVLAADIVGYTRLMEADESGTRDRIRKLHADVIDPLIAADGGRTVKLMGDGILVEFPSAVDAVRNALSVQSAVAKYNGSSPAALPIEMRIGINVGDLIVEGDDIHGDGVNVAARLEGLCEPGAVFVSGTVREHVDGKLDVAFEDLGEPPLKNIARQIRVFRVSSVQAAAQVRGQAAGATKADEKPSIAVLPFDNLSGDPNQDFLGDGLTEDIITGLSRIRSLFVIARNSTFQYRNTSPDIRTVAKELGVRYVLEGSVQQAGNRVRITAQLIEGASGNHIWAEKFDRELEDIFAVQDEITGTIVAQLEPELGRAEYERAKTDPPENLQAWGLFHRAMVEILKRKRQSTLEGYKLLLRASELDPSFSRAFAGLAYVQMQFSMLGYAEADLDLGFECAQKAVQLDDKDHFAHAVLGWNYLLRRMSAPAIQAHETSIRINPNFAYGHWSLATALVYSGQAERALSHAQTAIRLSPFDPSMGPFMARVCTAYLWMKDYDAAIEWGRKSIAQTASPWLSRAYLVSALGHAGKLDEAEQVIKQMREEIPNIGIRQIDERIPVIDDGYREHFLGGLRKAGLDE